MVAEPQVFDVALGKPSAVGRMQFGSSRELLEMPNLLEIQKKSLSGSSEMVCVSCSTRFRPSRISPART